MVRKARVIRMVVEPLKVLEIKIRRLGEGENQSSEQNKGKQPNNQSINNFDVKLCEIKKTRPTRTTEAQLSKFTQRYRAFHSCNNRKWLPYQILGGKTVKNV